MPSRYWSCPRCHSRNERIKQRCPTPGCTGKRPKPRVPKHARTLRDDSYEVYKQAAADIHGVADESCCVCGKPRSQERRHDRDHDHVTGLPRGLACAGNSGCNALMPRQLTLERARMIVGYLERVDSFYAALDALSASQEVYEEETV